MTATRYLALAALLSTTLSATAETRNEQADRRFQEARALLAGGKCAEGRCPGFAAGAAKLRAAWDLRPKLDYASYYCRAHQNAWKSETIAPRTEIEALAMCDATALFHADKARRDQARHHGARVRGARRSKGRLVSDWSRAIKALFGEGLVLTERGGTVTLAYGSVSASDLQGFIRDYYMPVVLAENLGSRSLLAPEEKVKICEAIAREYGGHKHADPAIAYCRYRAMKEATRVRHSFIGTRAVEFPPGKALYAVDAKLRYTPHIGIAGSAPSTDPGDMFNLVNLASSLVAMGKNTRYHAEAERTFKEARRKADEYRAGRAKIEKRLSRRNAILFFDRVPSTADLEKPRVKHLDSCREARVFGYFSPKVPEMTLSVDGSVCRTELLHSGKVAIAPANIESCADRLKKPGRHRIELHAYKTRWRNTGKRLNVRRSGRIDVSDTADYTRGGRFARGAVTCTGW